MIIADHHKPGHWYPSDTTYQPTCAWPEKCYVQWGDSGVVISAKGNYKTAFFEAFPGDNAGGFIRGEGKTIAEAEANAFAKYTKQIGCNHRWGRKGYTNGGGFCYHCNAFKVVFQPVHVFGDWRKPLSRMEAEMLPWDDILDARSDPDGSRRKYRRKLELRYKVFGKEPGPAD